MTKEDYLKLSKALATQVFLVTDRASEIIREIVKENADKDGYIDKELLYVNPDNPDWIWMQNNDRVVYLCINNCQQIFIGIQNDSCDEGDTLEYFLSDLNPLDRIEIADYLVEHF